MLVEVAAALRRLARRHSLRQLSIKSGLKINPFYFAASLSKSKAFQINFPCYCNLLDFNVLSGKRDITHSMIILSFRLFSISLSPF